MSSIRESLILDHFFFAASDEEFKELKDFFGTFQCTNHQVVKADNDSWEGLYIHTRSQYYLEILKTRRPNCIGLCQKPFNPLYIDARNIVQEFSDLPWQSFERSLGGQKWFTALSCDNYLDLTTPFNTWVVHYHQMVRPVTYRFPKYDIHTIFEFEVIANPELIDRIKLNSSWFHAEKSFGPDEIVFNFKTFYSDPMKMRIRLEPQVKGIQFSKMKFKLVEGVEISNLKIPALKSFALKEVDGHLEFEAIKNSNALYDKVLPTHAQVNPW